MAYVFPRVSLVNYRVDIFIIFSFVSVCMLLDIQVQEIFLLFSYSTHKAFNGQHEARATPWPAALLHVHRSHDGLREPQPDRSQDVSRGRRSSEGVPAGHDPLSLVDLADCKHMEIIQSGRLYYLVFVQVP